MDGIGLTRMLNKEFKDFFNNAFKIVRRVPGYSYPMLRHLFWQWRASDKRLKSENDCLHIPPFLIFSITRECNLNCKGCYSKHLHNNPDEDLNYEEVERIIREAGELGISIIMLAGGEPLIRKEILSIADKYPRIIFPLFTNGMLIDEVLAGQIARGKNVVPIISMEGDAGLTDDRRGEGVYKSVVKTFQILKSHHSLYGTSVTVTRDNFDHVTSRSFLGDIQKFGCKLIFFIEYIPCGDKGRDLVITHEQREKLKSMIEEYRKEKTMIFISFPGDEEIFGGCLAAGRGFVHISSSGRMEPCPFSPYSDISLKSVTLKKALESKLLKGIRDNKEILNEHEGGCSLWENRELVVRILEKSKNDV